MNILPTKGYVCYRHCTRKQMRQPCLVYVRWNDYLSKSFLVLVCQWTHCLAGHICKSESLTTLPPNWPLTYLPLKRQSKIENCDAYTQKVAFKARYKADSCNIKSQLLTRFLLSCWNFFLVINDSLVMLTQCWPHLSISIAPNTAKLS